LEVRTGKNVHETPSYQVAGHSGIHLSHQLHRRLRLERPWFQASPEDTEGGVHETPISTEKSRVSWCVLVIPATVQASLGKKQDPIFKMTGAKSARGMVQVVEHLPSKCKALSSKPQYHTK
jgi:hypothetical protein